MAKERQILAALPVAWDRLVGDEDEMLLEIVADRVENLCGFKPDPDTVAKFLKTTRAGAHPIPAPTTRTPRVPDRTVQPSPQIAPAPRPTSPIPSTVGFVLEGRSHPCRNAREVLVEVFEKLSRRDPTFPERFAALPKHGRTRRYLARNAGELYPGRPDLCREHSVKLNSGWWLGTNHSRATISRIVEMAADVVGLRFGSDLTANLGD